MPIYEYQCRACGLETEVLQKLSDAPLVDCPHCGEPALKKKVSAAAFRLKGGGWYETDFKTGDKKNLAGGGKETDAGKDTGSGKDSGSGKDAGSGDKTAATGSGKTTGGTSGESAKSA